MAKHKQVRIAVGNVEADVDDGMAPLLLELWRAGVNTDMSCQGNDPTGCDKTWIHFTTIHGARTFLRLAGQSELLGDDPLRGRWSREWEYTVSYCYPRRVDGKSPCNVRFPATELPAVLQRVQSNVADIHSYRDKPATAAAIEAAYTAAAAKVDKQTAEDRKWSYKWNTAVESVLTKLTQPAGATH